MAGKVVAGFVCHLRLHLWHVRLQRPGEHHHVNPVAEGARTYLQPSEAVAEPGPGFRPGTFLPVQAAQMQLTHCAYSQDPAFSAAFTFLLI